MLWGHRAAHLIRWQHQEASWRWRRWSWALKDAQALRCGGGELHSAPAHLVGQRGAGRGARGRGGVGAICGSGLVSFSFRNWTIKGASPELRRWSCVLIGEGEQNNEMKHLEALRLQ